MIKVIKIINIVPYKITALLSDNQEYTVDLEKNLVNDFSDLKDIEKFRQVKIDDYGDLYWSNGFDMSAEAFIPNYYDNVKWEKLA